MKPSTHTRADFDELAESARQCRLCPAMNGRARVLSRANGPHDARIMLVGEAPGRLGAEQTGVPFSGDESGRRLDRLLDAAGWSRAGVFITNAVLCNPRDERGNNRKPKTGELRNCNSWLRAQIHCVDPVLVVALGATALRSLAMVGQHNLQLSNVGDEPIPWFERWLAAAYHPGARAAIHRPTERQLRDFVKLGAWRAETAAARPLLFNLEDDSR